MSKFEWIISLQIIVLENMRVWICTTHRCTISAMDSCVFFNTNVWLRMGYPSITNILTFKRLPIPPPHTTHWLYGSVRKAKRQREELNLYLWRDKPAHCILKSTSIVLRCPAPIFCLQGPCRVNQYLPFGHPVRPRTGFQYWYYLMRLAPRVPNPITPH